MFDREERFGPRGVELPGDLNGMVPEEGDDWLMFAWSARDARRFSESPRAWRDFVARAAAATATLGAPLP